MAQVTVSKWTPFGVALDLTAGNITITRTSASKFTVHLSVSWKASWEDAQTDYGMDVTSGGVTKTISTQGTKRGSGSGSLTGTYSISTNGASTVPISVTFKNYNTWAGKSATKTLTLNVSVPAWTSYSVTYNANGGSGAPAKQTKWKDQNLKLSTTKPTKTGYTFLGWSTSNTATSPNGNYDPGDTYTANANLSLYAVWKANTYPVKYNANGGEGAPGTQTKTYGVNLTLSTTKPTRTNYNFKGWGTSATTSTVAYDPGDTYKTDTSLVLYAVWELAYVKPTISDLSVTRVAPDPETGELKPNDSGTTARVYFKWSTFLDVTSITISCNTLNTITVSTSGTSGEVEQLIGSGSLSTDSTYTVRVTVADGEGTAYRSSLTRTLPGTKFVIDFLAGGNGVSIGKPAETEHVFDVALQTKLNGGLLYPVLEPCNLDELLVPNIYSGRNAKDYSYTCGTDPVKPLPFTNGTFTLEVISSGPNGQILQRITVCDKNNSQVYERWYYTSSWSDWTGGWITATLGSEFAMYGTDANANQPKYRKDGRLVEVRGAVTPVNDIATGDDMHTILTLPVGYRPSSPIYLICQGSGSRIWLLRVTTNGNVDFSRYRDGDVREVAASGAWLPFQCTFLVG